MIAAARSTAGGSARAFIHYILGSRPPGFRVISTPLRFWLMKFCSRFSDNKTTRFYKSHISTPEELWSPNGTLARELFDFPFFDFPFRFQLCESHCVSSFLRARFFVSRLLGLVHAAGSKKQKKHTEHERVQFLDATEPARHTVH